MLLLLGKLILGMLWRLSIRERILEGDFGTKVNSFLLLGNSKSDEQPELPKGEKWVWTSFQVESSSQLFRKLWVWSKSCSTSSCENINLKRKRDVLWRRRRKAEKSHVRHGFLWPPLSLYTNLSLTQFDLMCNCSFPIIYVLGKHQKFPPVFRLDRSGEINTLLYPIDVPVWITEFWEKTLTKVLWLFLISENYFDWLTWFLALCTK